VIVWQAFLGLPNVIAVLSEFSGGIETLNGSRVKGEANETE
jgi:hypothetical protein